MKRVIAHLAVVIAVLGGAFVPGPDLVVQTAAATAAACETPVDVPGQGPSCPIPGGWQVLLDDGTSVRTHGRDAASHLYGPPSWPPIEPRCAEDLDLDYYGVAVYARPSDRPDRYATMGPEIRDMVAYANGKLREEAATFGKALDYLMACSTDGEVLVANVTLARPLEETDFGSIIGDLRAAGYNHRHAKYWVWLDTPWNGGGFGEIYDDDQLAPWNGNNTGPTYGVTYGTRLDEGGAGVMMHENGHNLGAVQWAAPHSSGAAHCNDGKDLMCYADGGPKAAYTETACPVELPFDCGHDDYFSLAPPQGSYLSNQWNLGSPLNRFVAGCLYQTGALSVGLPGLGLANARESVGVPSSCWGSPFAASGTVEISTTYKSTTSLLDVDACWVAGDEPLGCHTSGPYATGVVPVGATRVEVILSTGASTNYVLSAI